MIKLGFKFVFENNVVNIYCEATFYGHGFISDNGLIHLDIDYSIYNASISLLTNFDNDAIN